MAIRVDAIVYWPAAVSDHSKGESKTKWRQMEGANPVGTKRESVAQPTRLHYLTNDNGNTNSCLQTSVAGRSLGLDVTGGCLGRDTKKQCKDAHVDAQRRS